MTIKSLSSQIKIINSKLNQDFPADKKERVFGRTIKTQEEFGEFCNEVLAYFGKQRKEKLTKMKPEENLKKEWADVILSLFVLADELDWNIDEVLKSRMKQINSRMKIK